MNQQQPQVSPAAPSLLQRLRQRFADREFYGSTGDFLWALYSRVLRRPRVGPFFPGHGAIRQLSLRGIRGPLFARLGSTDWLVLQEVFIEGEYAMVANAGLRDVRFVLDLGANVGYTARLWQHLFPGTRVIAVEPDSRNFALCRKNVDAGPDPAAVTLVRAAVAAKPGTVFLDATEGEWAVRVTASPARGESVEARTVPELLAGAGAGGRINLLKCDIEGAEQDLFRDCSAWIRNVDNIVIEVHGSYTSEMFREDIRRNGADFDCTDVFRSEVYSVLWLRGRPGTQVPLTIPPATPAA